MYIIPYQRRCVGGLTCRCSENHSIPGTVYIHTHYVQKCAHRATYMHNGLPFFKDNIP